jgi:hypothetical protein
MKYIDREGNVITGQEWARLFRCRRYALVLEDGNGAECVVTSWVGVLSDLDPNQDLYMVVRQRKHHDPDYGIDRWRAIEEHWLKTEAAARLKHARVLADIRKNPPPPKDQP